MAIFYTCALLSPYIMFLNKCSTFRSNSPRYRRAAGQDMVQGTLPAWPACQSQGFVSEAPEVLCTERLEAQTTKATKEEVCHRVLNFCQSIIMLS